MSNRKRLPRPWRAARTPDEWLDALWSSPSVPHDAKILASVIARHAKPHPSGDVRFAETDEFLEDATAALAAFGRGDAA